MLVLARADNGVIGRNGALPWHLPADLKRFKTLTMGKPMVMGRRTFESLPAPLPGRRHIVLTRNRDWRAAGAEVAHDTDAAIALARSDTLMVIGGADLFAAFADRAHRIELTQVHAAPDGDTTVAAFDPASWFETARTDHDAEDGRPAYSFVTLMRRPPGDAGDLAGVRYDALL